MAYGFTTCACPAIQQALDNIARTQAYALRRDKVGMVDFLRSPANTAGYEAIQLDPKTGKRKTVDVNYYQKLCDSTVNESITDDCSTGNESVPYCETVEITNELETTNLVFDQDNMRRICAPLGAKDEDWIARIINAQLNALLVRLDRNVLTQVLAAVGSFMDGSTIKPVQLFNTVATDAQGPRTLAMTLFQDELDQAALMGPPNLIGANKLNRWVKAIGYGAVNSAGQDVGMMSNDFNFYYDRFLEGIFGEDEFLVVAPGVAQLLTWNKYVGDYAKANDVSIQGPLGRKVWMN